MEQITMLDRKPTYSDLPVEIISYIFSYLSYTDCLQAGSTCKLWRDVFFENNHKRTGKVYFAYICLSDSTSPGTYLLKSHRSYRTFHFDGVTFGDSAELIAHIGQTAVNVTFDSVTMSKEQFHLFMRHATNLESLTVKRCPNLLYGSFNDNDEEDITSSFASIRHLSLPEDQNLVDATFWRITSPIKMLESLDITAYPNGIGYTLPVLTFQLIAKVIKTHRKHIKELHLSNRIIREKDLELLAPSEEELDCMKLNTLKMASCHFLCNTAITSFLRTQPQLVVLDLSSTNCVNDDCLKILIETLPMLEDLNISECDNVTDEGCAHLGTLRRLKRLNIIYCEQISTDGLRRGIARTVNTQLRDLQMSGFNICQEGIKCIALNCLELSQWIVLDCFEVITDTSLKFILQHLRCLRDLTLDSRRSITENKSNTPLKDALFINDINPITNRFFIQSLKELRYLNLAGCYYITDYTLEHSIKSAALTYLNLSDCHQISSRGIRSVALNCPSIKQLDLSFCHQINDRDIDFLIENLSRLKYLWVDNCPKLTKNALDAIRNLSSSMG